MQRGNCCVSHTLWLSYCLRHSRRRETQVLPVLNLCKSVKAVQKIGLELNSNTRKASSSPSPLDSRFYGQSEAGQSAVSPSSNPTT